MEWKNIKYVTYHVQTHVVRALYNYGCDWYRMKNIWNYGKWNILTIFGVEDPNASSKDEKRKVLWEVKLIMGEICCNTTGIMCADGMTQRNYISREEATSTNITMKGIFASLIIDVNNFIPVKKWMPQECT